MDRSVRIALGALLVLVGVVGYAGFLPLAWLGIGQALAGVLAVVLGVILLATGIGRTCLIYSVLGISTAERSAEEPAESDVGTEKAA